MKNDTIKTCVLDFGIICRHLRFASEYQPVCTQYGEVLHVGAIRCVKCLKENKDGYSCQS